MLRFNYIQTFSLVSMCELKLSQWNRVLTLQAGKYPLSRLVRRARHSSSSTAVRSNSSSFICNTPPRLIVAFNSIGP